MSLHGKVALVTGADRRMDEGLIRAFADGGAQLAVLIPNHADIPTVEHDLAKRLFQDAEEPRTSVRAVLRTDSCETTSKSDVKAVVLACDLRYEEDVVRAVHRIGQAFGRIDVAVNAAAVVGPQLGVLDYPVEPWREVMATNITGVFLICREVLPWMLRQRSGVIVNVTDSSRGRRSSAYQFSMRAVESFTKLLADEVAGSGVRVSVVDAARGRPARRSQDAVQDWTKAIVDLASEESAGLGSQGIPAGGVVR